MAAPLFFTVTIFALVFVVLAAFVSVYLVKAGKKTGSSGIISKTGKSENNTQVCSIMYQILYLFIRWMGLLKK